jgi:Ca2+-dependent lipid-binding protein
MTFKKLDDRIFSVMLITLVIIGCFTFGIVYTGINIVGMVVCVVSLIMLYRAKEAGITLGLRMSVLESRLDQSAVKEAELDQMIMDGTEWMNRLSKTRPRRK